jgi:F0F1-type ATP synthase delta subunit
LANPRFKCGRWAEAFIRACTRDDEAEPAGRVLEGLRAVQVLYDGLSVLQTRDISGLADAERLDKAMKNALQKSGLPPAAQTGDYIPEYSRRLLVLLVKYGFWQETAPFLVELMARVEKMQGIVEAELDCAAQCSGAFLSSLGEKIKSLTGTKKVKINVHIKPEIIGGYRLQIQGKLYDFSMKCQLKQMEKEILK